jgi:hypothetical protein
MGRERTAAIFKSGRSVAILSPSLVDIRERPLFPDSDFRDELSQWPA